MTGHFEAKKHAYRQTQDGIVVSFVIHPNDLDAGFAVAALGTRYMVAFAEIGDDGKPVTSSPHVPPVNGVARQSELANETGNRGIAGANKERRPFASLPLSQQAAIRCQDNDFKLFMDASNADHAAVKVRETCRVTSRSQIIEGDKSGDYWLSLEAAYQAWLTDQRYAESARMARHG